MVGSVSIAGETFELEPSVGLEPVADARPRLQPLPPVRLVSVDDVRLPAVAGLADRLTTFYTGLLGFWPEAELVFRAENFRLRFEDQPGRPIERDTVKPLGIEVPLLIDVERRLAELEIECVREVGITPGRRAILVQDPAGNWLELFDSRLVG